MRQVRRQRSDVRTTVVISAFCLLAAHFSGASTAELYAPSWVSELNWVTGSLYSAPTNSWGYLEDAYTPWWQGRVAHPIVNYDASQLPVGSVRLDGALDLEYTIHRAKKSWDVETSPSGINNVYTFTPGSDQQEDLTSRMGQNAFFDFGFHPVAHVTGDIGIEAVGNYDQRYWFPVNDEHRMYKDNHHVKIVRGELKYDNNTVMLRGFEGTPNFNWVYQNDLFQLLPTQLDVERYRRMEGGITPRGGEARLKSDYGTLNVLGGTEPRFSYGPSVYVKYDAPARASWENSLVYRNEEVPFTLEPDERRWSVSYNTSWQISEKVSSHAGLLYQPFRIHETYQDEDLNTHTTKEKDAFGATWRVETRQTGWFDAAGLGYTYMGPIAGDKHQVDVDGNRQVAGAWNLSGAYIYRRPVIGPEPLRFEGTETSPGALIGNPRGPDDPFWVQWDNREAHIGSLTLLFDPTPGTYMFPYRKNVLEDWNLNADEDSTWTSAVQYRLTHYPTNTDRLYYFDEDRNLIYDPIFHDGALATEYPLSSATGLVRYIQDTWRITADMSGGQAPAGNAIAYTSATNFYKPTTVFLQGGVSVSRGPVKVSGRYAQDVWGPEDYHIQQGWAYHKIYQAGLDVTFLKDFLAGFRYIGTRMTNEYIGSDTGAFNEYRMFLTYHFGKTISLGSQYELRGREASVPDVRPEAVLNVSAAEFAPDGSAAEKSVTFYPRAAAEPGIYSWKLVVRDGTGAMVKQWEGPGEVPASLTWDGLGTNGNPLPAGVYRASLNVVDRRKNETTATEQTLRIRMAEPVDYAATQTAEGLKVTLSSKVLFDEGRSKLKPGATRALDQVIQLLRTYPTNKLRISGHADSSGSAALNQKLSERRANAVADYLAGKGIARTRMTKVGFGEAKPVATNTDEVGRAQNRRVEIDILK